ncbi:unnamed protein product [Ranitomeya imitator]|uniref:Uncharacterized protein n=1 Tax=Ranitomeya imitator TaxID=111125 RepID=A0ABN9MBE8_9NEOB|nr:unnamed protein product [Ranitomeya imitator]
MSGNCDRSVQEEDAAVEEAGTRRDRARSRQSDTRTEEQVTIVQRSAPPPRILTWSWRCVPASSPPLHLLPVLSGQRHRSYTVMNMRLHIYGEWSRIFITVYERCHVTTHYRKKMQRWKKQGLQGPRREQHKQDDEFSNVWHSLQGVGKPQYAPHIMNDQCLPQEKKPGQNMQLYPNSGNTENTSKCQRKKQELKNIGKQGFEFQNRQLDVTTQNVSEPETRIKLLRRNDQLEAAARGSAGTTEGKPNSEFENLFASLKIAGDEQAQPAPIMEAQRTTEEHLSPQSFAMVRLFGSFGILP